MIKRLDERVALITGAGQGIGAAIARRCVVDGARVVGIDRSAAALDQVVALQPEIRPFVADVRDHAKLERCVDETIASWGRIDILVNNAGIQYTTGLLESTLEQWRHTQAVNLEAQFVLCKLAVPHMIALNYGRIVNLASTQAIAVEPNVSAYAASKGGVAALTRSLAVELAPHNILVNAVAPGWIRTPMNVVDGVEQSDTDLFREWYAGRRKIPLARPGEANEIAVLVAFLASEECSYMTGQTLVADGGLTITF